MERPIQPYLTEEETRALLVLLENQTYDYILASVEDKLVAAIEEAKRKQRRAA